MRPSTRLRDGLASSVRAGSVLVALVIVGAPLLVRDALAGGIAVGDELLLVLVGIPVVTLAAERLRDRSAGRDAVADPVDASRGGDALAALRERYAAGEIDEDEFERRVERLVETERLAAGRTPGGEESYEYDDSTESGVEVATESGRTRA